MRRALVGEKEFWILPPGAVTTPPEDSFPDSVEGSGEGPTLVDARRLVGGTDRKHFVFQLPLDELTLRDGEVSAELKGIGLVVAKASASLAVYDPLKRELAELIGGKVRITGYVYANGSMDLHATGLEKLGSVFGRARVRRFVRQSEVSPGVVDVARLRSALSSGGSGEDIWDIEELGLKKRGEAMRRVFGLWNGRDSVLLIQEAGLLVPVDSSDGGPPWLVWERLERNRATYLFKPNAEQRGQLIPWLSDPDSRWSVLRDQPGLRAEIGFVDRVFHFDGDEVLESWWKSLLEAVGGPGEPGSASSSGTAPS